MSIDSTRFGWGTPPWGSSPWGGVSTASTPDINWSFEIPDLEDPPGADKWTWSAMDVGFWIAVFDGDYEFENWIISGYKFNIGSGVGVADFTTSDGSQTWAESFEKSWQGNTNFVFSLPDDSLVAPINDGVNLEDSESWVDDENSFYWKVWRQSFQLSFYSDIVDSMFSLPSFTSLTIGIATTDSDRPEWDEHSILLSGESETISELVNEIQAWFDSGSWGHPLTIDLFEDRLRITCTEADDSIVMLIPNSDPYHNDGWSLMGFRVPSRIVRWSGQEGGTFGNSFVPANPFDEEDFKYDWTADLDVIWQELEPDGYPWQFEDTDWQARFGESLEWEELFIDEEWPDSLDPLTL